MAKAYILLAEGFEEVEALAAADVLIRSGVETVLTGIDPMKREVCGSHGIRVISSECFTDPVTYDPARFGDADAVILPGGKQGTANLKASKAVAEMVKAYYDAGKYVCAICAAPTVLAACGILDGLEATCFPGFEKEMADAIYVDAPAIVTGNVITGRSMGTAVEFGLKVAEKLVGRETAEKTAASLHR
ncbi:MAG: DJ-1/PfpI family protein [Lachnospiraceae bacterium]|nr:DJ-1/PfpI family protein [Lachnospiraceae bacterium]